MKPRLEPGGMRATARRMSRSDWVRILLIWILTMIVRYGLAGVLIFFITGTLSAQPSERRHPVIVGEVMKYKVKWSFLRLGTVTIRQVPADSGNVLVQMTVQSAQGLPFINLHFSNQTYLNERSQAIQEETILSGTEMCDKTVYRHDRKSAFLIMEDRRGGEKWRCDSLKWEKECYDALGLMFHGRLWAGSGLAESLPTLNDYKINQTEISYAQATEEIKVEAFDSPRRCHLVSGNARWVGTSFAGMKGPFRGWITDDAAAIPLKACVEILLGSISLELESYECPGLPAGTQLTDTTSR
jgi:hypothetical protein